jgi:Uma2 family endonuclease
MLYAVLNRDEFKAVEGVTVDLPASGAAIVPDLVVAPRDLLRSLEWHQSCEGIELIVEVVSPRQGHRDHHVKQVACAKSGVPVYMVIDPYEANGTVSVCVEPQLDGTYAEVTTYAFGKRFTLPEPIAAEIDTAKFGQVPTRRRKPESAS